MIATLTAAELSKNVELDRRYPREACTSARIPDKSDTVTRLKIRRLLTDQESGHSIVQMPRLAISEGQDGLRSVLLTPLLARCYFGQLIQPTQKRQWLSLYCFLLVWLVEMTGFEPVASGLQNRRSPS